MLWQRLPSVGGQSPGPHCGGGQSPGPHCGGGGQSPGPHGAAADAAGTKRVKPTTTNSRVSVAVTTVRYMGPPLESVSSRAHRISAHQRRLGECHGPYTIRAVARGLHHRWISEEPLKQNPEVGKGTRRDREVCGRPEWRDARRTFGCTGVA